MNHHSFIESAIDKTKCGKCDRNYITHTKSASCEACGNLGNVEPFGELKGSKTMFLCSSCMNKEYELARNQMNTRAKGYDEVKTLAAIERVDHTIRFSGDFFNSKIASIEEMRAVINSDSSIPADEKHIRFQRALMDRFNYLQAHILEIDDLKHKDVTEQLAIKKTFTDLGNELRTEIREAIHQADISYQPVPPKPPKQPAIVRAKTPEDRVIEAIMDARPGISKEEARKLLATLK